jgi:hypothetical protein
MRELVIRPSLARRIARDLLSLGAYELWFRRTSYAVEDADVVIGRGLFVREETRIPTSKIGGVHLRLGSAASSVSVDTGSGRSVVVAPDVSRRDARRFANAIVASVAGRPFPATPPRRKPLEVAELVGFALGVAAVAWLRRSGRAGKPQPAYADRGAWRSAPPQQA